jgi:hypothetical protein
MRKERERGERYRQEKERRRTDDREKIGKGK